MSEPMETAVFERSLFLQVNVEQDVQNPYEELFLRYCHQLEENWREVRKILFDEIDSRRDHYLTIVDNIKAEYTRLLYTARWYEQEPCNEDYWMYMPDFGYAIANAYCRPLHFFSRHLCTTFLPDNAPICRNTPISIAHVLINGETGHFIPLWLKPNSPVPPVICKWENLKSDKSRNWRELFTNRIAKYEAEISE
jgi:hypothetical protein